MRRSFVLIGVALAGCGGKARAEMRATVEEAVRANRAEVLTAEVIELSADFTMGEAEENAAAAIRAWYDAEIPCADTTLSGTMLEVDFGDIADGCT